MKEAIKSLGNLGFIERSFDGRQYYLTYDGIRRAWKILVKQLILANIDKYSDSHSLAQFLHKIEEQLYAVEKVEGEVVSSFTAQRALKTGEIAKRYFSSSIFDDWKDFRKRQIEARKAQLNRDE